MFSSFLQTGVNRFHGGRQIIDKTTVPGVGNLLDVSHRVLGE